MRRSLYLTEGIIVSLDGPSILVQKSGKPASRVPVRLIDNVCIVGNFKMDSGIIPLFTSLHVPVTFLTTRGDIIATAMNYSHTPYECREMQRSLLKDEDGISRAENWIASNRKKYMLELLRIISPITAKGFEEKGFKVKDYFDTIKAKGISGEGDSKVVGDVIQGLLNELIIERLASAGLDPHIGIYHRRHNYGLCKDICYILRAEIDRHTWQLLKGHSVKNDLLFNIIQRFEYSKKLVKGSIEALIDDLFDIMRECRYEG